MSVWESGTLEKEAEDSQLDIVEKRVMVKEKQQKTSNPKLKNEQEVGTEFGAESTRLSHP